MVTTLMNMTCDLVTKNAKLNLLQPERNFCELLRNASRAVQVLKVRITNDNSVDLQVINCFVQYMVVDVNKEISHYKQHNTFDNRT